MTNYNQPRRLENLSLTAVGVYVSELCFRLVKMIQPHGDLVDSNKLLLLEQTCSRLQERFHTTVPYVVANDLASEVLKHLDYCYRKIHYNINEPWCQKILQGLVKATMHSDLTVIDITWEWTYIAQIVTSQILSLRKLKDLKLTAGNLSILETVPKNHDKWIEPLAIHMYALSRLETLSVLFSCNDDVLKAAGEWCKQLKNLDVSGSREVTDESIGGILKMSCLEKLNIANTSLSESGYTMLLERLSRNRTTRGVKQSHALRSLGCECYTTSQLRLIVTECINLDEVHLTVRECNVSVLRTLDNLQKLSVNFAGFPSVKELLYAKGENILELKLDLDFNMPVDLKFVIDKCPNLTALTVMGITCANDDDGVFQAHLSLTHITLQTRNSSAVAYLLSRCHNLAVLELCVVQTFFSTYLITVLTTNPLRHLIELTVGIQDGNLTAETLGLLTEHCTNLRVFKIFGRSSRVMENLCNQYPGVRYTSDSKWKLPLFEIIVKPPILYNLSVT